MLYLDSSNVIHDIIWNQSATSWDSGNLAGKGYTALENSGLSAMYHQCQFCSNTTVIAFQDPSGNVQVGNLTSAGWTLTKLDMNPQLPTGLALQSQLASGLEDQINLYYQKADLSMALTSRKPYLVARGGESDSTVFTLHLFKICIRFSTGPCYRLQYI